MTMYYLQLTLGQKGVSSSNQVSLVQNPQTDRFHTSLFSSFEAALRSAHRHPLQLRPYTGPWGPLQDPGATQPRGRPRMNFPLVISQWDMEVSRLGMR